MSIKNMSKKKQLKDCSKLEKKDKLALLEMIEIIHKIDQSRLLKAIHKEAK